MSKENDYKVFCKISFFQLILLIIIFLFVSKMCPYKQTIVWENGIYRCTTFHVLFENNIETYDKSVLKTLEVYTNPGRGGGVHLYPFSSTKYFLEKTAKEDKANLQNNVSGDITRFDYMGIVYYIGFFIYFLIFFCIPHINYLLKLKQK